MKFIFFCEFDVGGGVDTQFRKLEGELPRTSTCKLSGVQASSVDEEPGSKTACRRKLDTNTVGNSTCRSTRVNMLYVSVLLTVAGDVNTTDQIADCGLYNLST